MAKRGRAFGTYQYTEYEDKIIAAVELGGSVRIIQERYNRKVRDWQRIAGYGTMKSYLDRLVTRGTLYKERYGKVVIYRKKEI